jgi:hypothetical protein
VDLKLCQTGGRVRGPTGRTRRRHPLQKVNALRAQPQQLQADLVGRRRGVGRRLPRCQKKKRRSGTSCLDDREPLRFAVGTPGGVRLTPVRSLTLCASMSDVELCCACRSGVEGAGAQPVSEVESRNLYPNGQPGCSWRLCRARSVILVLRT